MALTDEQAEVAAKSLAKNLDYPWSYMTPKGREEMRQMARDAFSAATAPLLARIAELEAENHNLNWALGTEGFDQMATPEEQAEHEKGHAAAMANIARMKAHKERHDQLVPDGVDYLDHIAALTAQVEQAAQPVHYRALLAEEQRPHQLKTSMHVVGFRTWKSADDFVASERDMNGWRYTIEPLYTAPPKAVPLTDPVMIYHGACVIDCGEHGHHDVELLRMIPAGTKLYTHGIGTPATVEKGGE